MKDLWHYEAHSDEFADELWQLERVRKAQQRQRRFITQAAALVFILATMLTGLTALEKRVTAYNAALLAEGE